MKPVLTIKLARLGTNQGESDFCTSDCKMRSICDVKKKIIPQLRKGFPDAYAYVPECDYYQLERE